MPNLGLRMHLESVSPTGKQARILFGELDRELAERYPGALIHGINPGDFKKAGGYLVIAKTGNTLLGCGAFRPLNRNCAEVKRMFVRPAARRRGVARQILRELVNEIRRRGFRSVVLETGNKQPEAIALYESEGFFPIPAFLDYVGNPASRCYAKPAQAGAPISPRPTRRSSRRDR